MDVDMNGMVGVLALPLSGYGILDKLHHLSVAQSVYLYNGYNDDIPPWGY